MQTFYRWPLLFGVWLLYACFGLVATSLAPIVGLVESDLDLSHAAMGSIMGAWQLTYIVSAIPCGILLDKIGSRWALAIGSLFIAGSAFARGMAPDYISMIAAVMLFGVGGPIISAGAPKVITQWFAGQSRGLAMGIYMTGPAIGGIISLTMTHSLLLPWLGSWRVLMFVFAFSCAMAGGIWLIIAASPLLNEKEQHLKSGAGLPGSGALKNLLSQPAVLLVLLMSVAVFMFNHGLNNWLPELLRKTGMGLIEAGYWAAIPTVIGIAGSLLIPRLATPGRRFYILSGLAIFAATASLLLQLSDAALLFSGLFLQGVARSSLMTVLILTLVELPGIGERNAGIASGLFFSAAEVGGVLGPVSLGLLYDWTGDFSAGLFLLTGLASFLAVAAMVLKRIADRSL